MRKRLTDLASTSAFLRHVSILAGGTVFAQGLGILSMPILTRLYSPADFSLLAVFSAVIGLISVASCLRLNIAIPLPQADEDAINLLALSLIAASGISLSLALVVILLPTEIGNLLQKPGITPYLWMIPLGVFLAAVYNALQYWMTRQKQFCLITRTRITRAVGGAGTQFAVGLAVPGAFGLIFGHMVYGGLGVVGLASEILRNNRATLATVNMRAALTVLYTYRHFPTHSLPAALLDAGYQFLPILIMASVVSDAEMGRVFLAMKIVTIPVSLLGASISQVYLASAGDKMRSDTLGSFTRRAMLRLFMFGGPSLIVIAIISFYTFGWIFGKDYADAGRIVIWMTPWFILQLVSSPVSTIFAAVNKQTSWLLLQAIGFVLIVGTTLLSLYFCPVRIVEVFSMVNTIFYFMVIVVILRLTYLIQGVS